MFYYQIRNNGLYDVTQAYFRIDTNSSTPDIVNNIPLSIPANSTFFGFVNWNYTSPGVYNPTFTIDWDNSYRETNEANNQLSTSVAVSSRIRGSSPLFFKSNPIKSTGLI